VKNRFQNLPFKFNLQCYTAANKLDKHARKARAAREKQARAGLVDGNNATSSSDGDTSSAGGGMSSFDADVSPSAADVSALGELVGMLGARWGRCKLNPLDP
jgi:hypothetical protein